ncbi:hypothetical protein SCYAM73S_07734 [Streptomyces cyaneofuscatus]
MAPRVLPLAPSDVQTIRSSGTCSCTVALKLREEGPTLTFQSVSASSPFETLWTPFMKPLNSSYCVHAS